MSGGGERPDADWNSDFDWNAGVPASNAAHGGKPRCASRAVEVDESKNLAPPGFALETAANTNEKRS